MRSISFNRLCYLALLLCNVLLKEGFHFLHFLRIFTKADIRFDDSQDNALEEIMRTYICIDNFCQH